MKTIYFDNAATSKFKPFCVKKSFFYWLNHSANAGRSAHSSSIKNSQIIWQTREKIAETYGGIQPENVIFTKNCTESLNIVIQSLCKNHSGNIVYSCFEHNSVLRPLHEMAQKYDITLTKITPKNKKFITLSDLVNVIQEDTFLVCINSISNVTGNKNDWENIAKFCKEKHILYLLDNAQGAGHIKIDMKKGVNFLTFSGHKGYNTPQGIGALLINTKEKISPLIMGGTGSESDNVFQPLLPPESLESGTQSTPLIASLKSGIEYNEKYADIHQEKLSNLVDFLVEQLSTIPQIKIYSFHNFSGVVSFNVAGFDSIEVCDYLSENYKIACRGGLHCAPLAHEFLGTKESGIVRISLSFKNTYHEIKKLIQALNNLLHNPL